MIIWIVDDHPLLTSALESMAAKEFPEAEVRIFHIAKDAESNLDQQRPNLVITDIDFDQKPRGFDLVKYFATHCPESKILVLTMHAEKIYIEKSAQFGAHGFLAKSSSAAEIFEVVRALLRNETHFPQLSPNPNGHEPQIRLSPREREVTKMVLEGKNSKEIAEVLRVSVRTIESHRLNILRKTKASNTAQLLIAMKQHLFLE